MNYFIFYETNPSMVYQNRPMVTDEVLQFKFNKSVRTIFYSHSVMPRGVNFVNK